MFCTTGRIAASRRQSHLRFKKKKMYGYRVFNPFVVRCTPSELVSNSSPKLFLQAKQLKVIEDVLEDYYMRLADRAGVLVA